MKCAECIKEGKTSKVFVGLSMTTCLGYSLGYYNEDGVWVENKNPNKTTTDYSCSNNHRWREPR